MTKPKLNKTRLISVRSALNYKGAVASRYKSHTLRFVHYNYHVVCQSICQLLLKNYGYINLPFKREVMLVTKFIGLEAGTRRF